ncbi:MAG TPA: phosphoribosyltransferase family protein [bacterium]|nr:phosphoribosyltransferase family protein [bacterium]
MPEAPETIAFTSDQIESTVSRLAGEISGWVNGKGITRLHLISVLEGARSFTRDLLPKLQKLTPGTRIKTHEIRINGTDGTRLLDRREELGQGLSLEKLRDFPVLIVDDLADSGKTLSHLKGRVFSFGISEVKTAVLIRKFCEESGEVDFLGFDLRLNRAELEGKGLKDLWLYGYGMDLDGQKRELGHIGWIEIK